MERFVFFTFNNFTQDDGGTNRMRGIINALVDANKEVLLISNCQEYHKFDIKVKHIFLNYFMYKRQKQVFQTALAFFPIFCDKYMFSKLIKRINSIFNKHKIDRNIVIFFEYLDNSLGYLLQRTGIIENYINDIHGIAPLEFTYPKNINSKVPSINYLKYFIVRQLDKKVMLHAYKLLFVSTGMREYYETLYKSLNKKNNFILRDGTSKELCTQKIDMSLFDKLKLQYSLKSTDNIILFIGDFKDFGGVLELIESFIILYHREKVLNLKLLLVGTGERFEEAQKIVSDKNFNDTLKSIEKLTSIGIHSNVNNCDYIFSPKDLNI